MTSIMETMRQPPRPQTADGRIRKVGVEIEFGDVPLDRAAEAVRTLFGGTVRQDAPFAWKVLDTRFGTFAIELDSQYAQPEGPLDGLKGTLRLRLAEMLGTVGQAVVPSEVTCPPVPYTELDEIAHLMTALCDIGATGTFDSVLYAFGLQLNPEVATEDVGYITAVLKAYLLLSDRMRRDIAVDLLRDMLPFADPFPLDYRARVAAPDYAPGMAGLIEDYVTANPTRNRELDMLPLFAHIDGARVRRAVPDPRISARPTFHYRLPNAIFRHGAAHLLREWNRWVIVEELAENAKLLAAMGAAFGRETSGSFDAARWAAHCDAWLAQ